MVAHLNAHLIEHVRHSTEERRDMEAVQGDGHEESSECRRPDPPTVAGERQPLPLDADQLVAWYEFLKEANDNCRETSEPKTFCTPLLKQPAGHIGGRVDTWHIDVTHRGEGYRKAR